MINIEDIQKFWLPIQAHTAADPQPVWASAQVIKVRISDRYSTCLLRDEITGGFRAADGSLWLVEQIVASGYQVTVIEP